MKGADILGGVVKRASLGRCQSSRNLKEAREGATWIPGGICMGVSSRKNSKCKGPEVGRHLEE